MSSFLVSFFSSDFLGSCFFSDLGFSDFSEDFSEDLLFSLFSTSLDSSEEEFDSKVFFIKS